MIMNGESKFYSKYAEVNSTDSLTYNPNVNVMIMIEDFRNDKITKEGLGF